MEDPGIRRLWIEFLGKRLVELGEVIADAVHKVNPDIEVGLMIPCIHPLTVMGHTITNVLEAFRGRRRPLVRPPIGPYRDWNRRDIIPAFSILITRVISSVTSLSIRSRSNRSLTPASRRVWQLSGFT